MHVCVGVWPTDLFQVTNLALHSKRLPILALAVCRTGKHWRCSVKTRIRLQVSRITVSYAKD